MKRFRLLLIALGLSACVVVPVAWAASNRPSTSERYPGAPVAHAISTVTGMAISPLLGASAFGLYQWVQAEEAQRPNLPWYAQPKFWVPALLLVGICAAKDSFGTAVPPFLKKPLDVLEVVESKFSGLIAAGAVVPFAMDAFSRLLLESAQAQGGAAISGFAMIPHFASSWAPVLNLLTIPLGIAMFLVVWMASHAINVLILLSPWGGIDAALKAGRTALLGLITLTATMNPLLSAALSLVVIGVSYLVAGWSFRLTVFGAIFSWEFVTRRSRRFRPAQSGNRMFSGAGLDGVPVRTYGRLDRREDGSLEFVYRPWLVREPRMVTVPLSAQDVGVGEGFFVSIIGPDTGRAAFVLPPRYRGHESEVAEAYGFGLGVQPAGLRKAWGSFKELLGMRPAALPSPAKAAG